jgi:hypothetical protein
MVSTIPLVGVRVSRAATTRSGEERDGTLNL